MSWMSRQTLIDNMKMWYCRTCWKSHNANDSDTTSIESFSERWPQLQTSIIVCSRGPEGRHSCIGSRETYCAPLESPWHFTAPWFRVMAFLWITASWSFWYRAQQDVRQAYRELQKPMNVGGTYDDYENVIRGTHTNTQQLKGHIINFMHLFRSGNER